MKKLLLMLTTVFTLSMSASGPLRFKQIKIVATPLFVNLEVTIAGDTPKYTYSGVPGIDPFVTDGKKVIFAVIPNTSNFTLSVTDFYGDVIKANIALCPEVTGHITFIYTHPTCNALANGNITVVQNTGLPVMYTLNSLQNLECDNTSSCTFTELNAEKYEEQVFFGHKMFSVTADLVNLDPMSFVFARRPATCGKNNGEIEMGGIGGGSGEPYLVEIEGPVSQSLEFPTDGNTFSDLPAGIYSMTVTSPDGCVGKEANIEIKEWCD